jgi:hypothetical protein
LRRLVGVVMVAIVCLALAPGLVAAEALAPVAPMAAGAHAQGGGGPDIIPAPNSGSEPVREGDRGSASQFAVLGGILLGFATIFLLIRRESRKAKARKPQPVNSSGTEG